MSNTNPISLLIPAYNEAERLAPFLDSVVDYNQTHPSHIHEIIIIDDGSTDSTYDLAASYSDKLPVRLLKHQKNSGKGAAIKTGVFSATAEYIVFTDADGATPITELSKMLSALHDHQIVVGNRWIPGSKTDRHSLLRKLSGWTYRQYMKFYGLGQIDTMCGFKGYHRNVALDLFKDLIDNRWLFDTEIAYKAVHLNYSITNIPVEWESKEGSKLSAFSLIKSALGIRPLLKRVDKTLSMKSNNHQNK